ncbi:MAG TPA: D-glycero-beta-D-manno-heptose 1-phosphate adenylyltransferase [Chitinophagaceae bacterium]|nr:D-glycero-beta-D-manno-heptose 1-phosphate adenylyltransferase [Chitinophagaceae bacterium]
MRRADLVTDKIYSVAEISRRVMQWRLLSKSIAFTNGVFDILHPGHIYSIAEAASQADLLVVGLNSDASVKRLKGADRPVCDQDARALLLASLLVVDAVVIFEEDTPLELIRLIRPDVLVKGGDYTPEQIAGARDVQVYGGRVHIHPVLEGHSTTSIIGRIRGE